MTQTTLEVAPAAETSSGSSRNLLLAGGLVAVLALAGGGYVLLSGSSEDVAAGPVVTHHKLFPRTVTAKRVAPSKKAPSVVPAVSTVPIGRDPFHSLYIAPVTSAITTATTTTTPTTSTSTTSTSTSSATSTAPKVYKLTLTGVSGSGKSLTATFVVGGKLMVAKVGSVFGPTSELKLLSLTQNAKGVWVATIQVGDSEPVDASKGQALYVR